METKKEPKRGRPSQSITLAGLYDELRGLLSIDRGLVMDFIKEIKARREAEAEEEASKAAEQEDLAEQDQVENDPVNSEEEVFV